MLRSATTSHAISADFLAERERNLYYDAGGGTANSDVWGTE